jgi:uncharacterized protein YndB with AHSA1/START domain
MSERAERVVERERVLDAEPERVWDALTDEYLLEEWLETDRERSQVHVVEEERELAFTWSRPGEGESLVTFILEPLEVGTRLIVTERTLAGPTAIAAAGALWSRRLRSLELCLGRLVLA